MTSYITWTQQISIEYSTQTPKNIHLAKEHTEATYKIDPTLGQETNLYIFKETEVTHCILSDHYIIKLKLNMKQIYSKRTNSYGLNNSLLNDKQVNEEIKKQMKKIPELN